MEGVPVNVHQVRGIDVDFHPVVLGQILHITRSKINQAPSESPFGVILEVGCQFLSALPTVVYTQVVTPGAGDHIALG